MQITRLGHSALLVEASDTRLLVDPGGLSDNWHPLTDLDGVLVTHQHADHVDTQQLPSLLDANPSARVVVEPAVVEMIDRDAEAASVGERVTIGSVTVEVVGGRHALIHEDVPRVGNVGFVLSEGSGPRVFHPGDSLETAPDGVDVLAVPLVAPWSNVGATIDFARAVGADRMFPIHDAIVSPAGRGIFVRMVSSRGGSEWTDPSLGAPFSP